MNYVMSDIHGNKRRFDSIMEQINLRPEDHLYVIGDVIDRHPYGIDILLQIMEMPNATMLLGNHERMMLYAIDYFRQGDPFDAKHYVHLWRRNSSAPTVQAWEQLDEATKEKIIRYLMSLPLTKTIVVGHKRYMLVHAAPPKHYNPRYHHYDTEAEFCVWERIGFDEKLPKGYTYIIGHTPTDYFVERERLRKYFKEGFPDEEDDTPPIMSIWRGDHRICIDCGSGYPDTFQREYGAMGRLACLRLDDGKEFYSNESFNPEDYRIRR